MNFTHTIIGSGYTSILAYYLLKKKGYNPTILKFSNLNTSLNLSLQEIDVSPIPIFPVKGTELFEELDLQKYSFHETLKIRYLGEPQIDKSKIECLKGSLADYLSKDKFDNKPLAMSLKQWGTSIYTEPYSQVSNKIENHYSSGKPLERIGYLKNHSLYYHLANKIDYSYTICNSIMNIDLDNKKIFTDHGELNFTKVISTFPLYKLLRIFNIECHLKHEGAYFLFFKHKSLLEINEVLYDSDLNSDVLRIFVVSDKILKVQVPSYRKETLKLNNIKKRLYDLIPNLSSLFYIGDFNLKMAYPIETIQNELVLEKIEFLKNNSVIPFGRFGNWEYSDLHELNWESII